MGKRGLGRPSIDVKNSPNRHALQSWAFIYHRLRHAILIRKGMQSVNRLATMEDSIKQAGKGPSDLKERYSAYGAT